MSKKTIFEDTESHRTRNENGFFRSAARLSAFALPFTCDADYVFS